MIKTTETKTAKAKTATISEKKVQVIKPAVTAEAASSTTPKPRRATSKTPATSGAALATSASSPKTRKSPDSAPPAKPKTVAKKASNLKLPSQEVINKMVEEAAYYLAEKRNFAPGFETEDWEAAKSQIMAQLENASTTMK